MTGYMPKSKTDSWSTPKALYDELNKEFSFDDYDPCPLNDNPEKDGLSEEWAAITFCNPPYSDLKSTKKKLGWVDKAHKECQKGKTIVLLIPARTDTQWFHDVILQNCYEVRFLKGRLKFGDCKVAAPFPSMVIVMKKSPSEEVEEDEEEEESDEDDDEEEEGCSYNFYICRHCFAFGTDDPDCDKCGKENIKWLYQEANAALALRSALKGTTPKE